ncbi:MAG: Asp-tRNA(Asn)/Glu-tRNA(Gln) amidotransferase subunit GatC [Oscillospiraceae bacterium]
MEIDVKHIAKLARLTIEAEKVESFTAEMAAIVKMVENLPELAGAGSLLEPNNTMQLREDVVAPSDSREEILANAPEKADGCFLVPRTVD